MSSAVTDLNQLLRSMQPRLNPGVFVFCVLPNQAAIPPECIGLMRESEGMTVVVPENLAIEANLTILFRASWITLQVHSDLQAVGLTAAFASALTQAGISCNVIAGGFHDHLFVPIAKTEQALRALSELQIQASGSAS
ncbi:ACT domain-containing protein [Undibacterium sp. FT137W]|uniref:ACT domain-containing protein n=1 Tax=Undibacterium fentianense TaxID=2828728 RepID=A0A941IIA4_9BURK|nr:ACT domain-containing protein [Undibacterium fentianense]